MLEPALVPEEEPPLVPVPEAALLPPELEAAAVVEPEAFPAALPAALKDGPLPVEDEVETDAWQPMPATTSTTQSFKIERVFPPPY